MSTVTFDRATRVYPGLARPAVDHLDLDSHLNLLDDPFDGPTFTDGVVRPSDRPGLGVRWTGADA